MFVSKKVAVVFKYEAFESERFEASQMLGEFPKRKSVYTPRAEWNRIVCLFLFFVSTKIDLCLFARKKFLAWLKGSDIKWYILKVLHRYMASINICGSEILHIAMKM